LAKKDQELQDTRARLSAADAQRRRLAPVPAELHALFPDIDSVFIGDAMAWHATRTQSGSVEPTPAHADEIVVVVQSRQSIANVEQERMQRWLETRTQQNSIRLVIQRIQ
jgi:hypothetical protein